MFKNKKSIANTVSAFLFFVSLVVTILFFVLDILKVAQNNQMGLTFDLSVSSYVFSFIFTAIISLMVGFSYYFKSKLMALLPLCYLSVTAIVFLCLFILMSNPSVDIYVLTFIAFSVFAPLCGFWLVVKYYIALLVILPLFFFSIVFTYKIFKIEKEEKLANLKKKK